MAVACGHENSRATCPFLQPLAGTVRAFGRRSGLLRPLLTSAPRSGSLAVASVQGYRDTTQSPGVSPAAFLAHPPDLQSWPLMDMDFATSARSSDRVPHIRFLFVGSRFRSTLPSDGPSRFRPCASLVLHLHQVAQGTCTPRLLDMPSTQEAALRAPASRLRHLTPPFALSQRQWCCFAQAPSEVTSLSGTDNNLHGVPRLDVTSQEQLACLLRPTVGPGKVTSRLSPFLRVFPRLWVSSPIAHGHLIKSFADSVRVQVGALLLQ